MRSGAPTPLRMQSAAASFIFRFLKTNASNLTTTDTLGLTNSATLGIPKRSFGLWKA
jgi:hypothetical protein